MNKKFSISTFALAMLMVGAVDGISNLPSIAIFGQQLVFFFIIGTLLFLLPTGLVSAELCKQLPEHSGVYAWAKKAFGNKFATVVVWMQWINTMIWFPTCLTTLVGTAAYIINPVLIHHPGFLVITSLSCFWIMTLLNLKGFKHSTKIAAFGTVIGMVIPITMIILLSIVWFMIHKPMAIHLNSTSLLPHLGHTATWTSLTAIITSFLGMELATVHVKKVHNAQHMFPKALVIAVTVIVLTMGIGSLGVALVIPQNKIVLVSGAAQAFYYMFAGLHVMWLAKVLGCMLVLGPLGAMVNWLISPANGLTQAAKDHPILCKIAGENKNGVPAKILLLQGIVVSFVSLAFFLLPTVNGSYWYLLDLSTELYVGMYILMFITAIKLTSSFKVSKVIPGHKVNLYLLCALGIIGSLISFIVGFFPPDNIQVGSHLHYIFLFAGGILLAIIPGAILGLASKDNVTMNHSSEFCVPKAKLTA
jgi:amino acid transporter